MINEDKYAELESLIYTINQEKSYLSRIKKELTFIKSKRSAHYLLIAYEIINDLKQKGVIIGPADGFTNSSLINYLLGFTSINPIKYKLICEPYFSLKRTYLPINVSNKKSIIKKYLTLNNNPDFKIHELPILKKYQVSLLKANYTFYPQKLQKNYWEIDIRHPNYFPLQNWKYEFGAIEIKNENDLINSCALAHLGIKGFHISKMLQNQHIPFKELVETNNCLLYREQWIKLVAKYTKVSVVETCRRGKEIFKSNYSVKNFSKLFSTSFNKSKINYLFEIRKFMYSKAHSISEASILCLALNYKKVD